MHSGETLSNTSDEQGHRARPWLHGCGNRESGDLREWGTGELAVQTIALEDYANQSCTQLCAAVGREAYAWFWNVHQVYMVPVTGSSDHEDL
jgi:hypothetical protein